MADTEVADEKYDIVWWKSFCLEEDKPAVESF